MGLDQYLKASLHTFKPFGKEKEHKIRPILRKALPEIFSSGNFDSINVSFEAGYWRKANAIHKWFVDNVQDGKDDCKTYYVDREQLRELRELCKKVLQTAILKKSKIHTATTWKDGKETKEFEDGDVIKNAEEIAEILPASSGFFFGSTNYDEYYLEQIKKTIKIIDRCLKLPEEWDFDYHSSW